MQPFQPHPVLEILDSLAACLTTNNFPGIVQALSTLNATPEITSLNLWWIR